MRFRIKLIITTTLVCGALWFLRPDRQTPNPSPPSVATDSMVGKTDPLEPDSVAEMQPLTNSIAAEQSRADTLDSLCREKRFRQALEIAKNAPEEFRSDQLNVVFARWAQSNPDEAMIALTGIQDEPTRTQLFRTVADTWSANEPAALADYAVALPEGTDRNYAFTKATDNWSLQDPATMGEWLNTLPPSPEFDRAIAALLAKTDSVNRSPEVAMSWMEGINDPELRRGALAVIARQWAESDLPAAEKYVANVSWITPAQRDAILQSLTQRSKIAADLRPADSSAFN